MFDLRVLTPPDVEPVTPAELAVYLKLIAETSEFSTLGGGERADCALFAQAAREHAEGYTRRALMTQTLQVTAYAPALRTNPYDYTRSGRIPLLRPPIQSVTSVTADGVAVAADEYALLAEGAIVHADGYAPWSYGSRVAVTYVAGYGADPEAVPAAIRVGIRKVAATMYEHREDVIVGTVQAAIAADSRRYFDPYRVPLV